MIRLFLLATIFVSLVAWRPTQVAAQVTAKTRIPIDRFIDLAGDNQIKRISALDEISKNWNDDDAAMMIEAARFVRDPRTRRAIMDALQENAGQNFGSDFDKWFQWIWNRQPEPHPGYATFKSEIYSRIDPRFAEYFSGLYPNTIRLDEIRWGGVLRDGIPPLKDPEVISAASATYLGDSDVVFGVEFGGQSRAYPKRILAWHEMVKDVVGGRSINGVYCTLCGSMIVYDTNFNGKHYELGTSGFLYRSNKLMYDHDTKSMWSTLEGKPVVGPLVGRGIELEPLYVVTTTWGKWKAQHPDTDVLSLRTGHRRDYGEGVAYKSYFATDELMFTVPKLDTRLKNKDEVLIVRGGDETPKVISANFLRTNRVYQDKLGEERFVVLTDSSGANRVYDAAKQDFDRWSGADPDADRSSTSAKSNDKIGSVVASDGSVWNIEEDQLVGPQNQGLRRIPAHRAFWFGWSAAFPGTELVQ